MHPHSSQTLDVPRDLSLACRHHIKKEGKMSSGRHHSQGEEGRSNITKTAPPPRTIEEDAARPSEGHASHETASTMMPPHHCHASSASMTASPRLDPLLAHRPTSVSCLVPLLSPLHILVVNWSLGVPPPLARLEPSCSCHSCEMDHDAAVCPRLPPPFGLSMPAPPLCGHFFLEVKIAGMGRRSPVCRLALVT